MRAAPSRAVVIGGSVAGLAAAVMLRRHGWQVDVYERANEDLVNRGAGIATQDVLYDALRSAGVELRDEMGVHCKGRIMFDAGGQVLGTHAMEQTMTSWGLIYRFLREQIPADHYHLGHDLRDIEQGPGGVRAHFENGGTAAGEWLIGADGARSTVRRLLAPDITLDYCGYYLWRGLLDEYLIPDDVLRQVAHRMMFGMGPGGHWVGYLVAGPGDSLEPGSRWYNWGWYRTGAADVLADHLTDAHGNYYEHGIPHSLIRPELVEAMRKDARDHLSPQIQAVITATTQPFLQGIYEAGCERLLFDRCAIIGDAAFTARPHVGMGVCKAIEDAATLAAALTAPDPNAACASWESERLRFGKAVMQCGRDMGSYIGPPPPDDEARAKAAHYQKPEILLSVSAASSPVAYLDLETA